MESMIYLNYCGVSPLARAAYRAQQRFAEAHMLRGAGMFADYKEGLTGLRRSAAELLDCAPEDITYTDNTAEGVNYVANGYPFQPGDQIISYVHEYPANHYPWVLQKRRGVELLLAGDSAYGGRYPSDRAPRGFSLDAIEQLTTRRTRIIALSHVQFTSGFALDLPELGAFCAERQIDLVIDAAQSLGLLPLDVGRMNIAALASSGWKWLCGPVGSGLLYTSPALREKLAVTMAGGDMMQQGEDYLNHEWNPFPDGRKFEFSTQPFAEALGLEAAIRAVLEYGVERGWQRQRALQEKFVSALRCSAIEAVELDERHRSGILSLQAPDPVRLATLLRARGVFMTARGGYLRFAPHFFTADEEIEQAAAVLNECVE